MSSPPTSTGAKGRFLPRQGHRRKRTRRKPRIDRWRRQDAQLPSLMLTVMTFRRSGAPATVALDAAEDDDGLGAGVVQPMLELARRVQRIDVGLDRAGTDDAEEGDRDEYRAPSRRRGRPRRRGAPGQPGRRSRATSGRCRHSSASCRRSASPAGRRSASSPLPSWRPPSDGRWRRSRGECRQTGMPGSLFHGVFSVVKGLVGAADEQRRHGPGSGRDCGSGERRWLSGFSLTGGAAASRSRMKS